MDLLPPLQLALCCAISFIAGLIDAMAGGGGILTLPTVAWAAPGLGIATVCGSNKVIGTAGSSTATLRFLLKGKADRTVALFGGILAALGGVAGVFALEQLEAVNPDRIKAVFAVLLIAIALYMAFKKEIGGEYAYDGHTPRNLAILAASGLGIGFYDGFFGPGTGSFLVFVMVRFLRFDFVIGTGNAKALNFGSNVGSLVTFIAKGLVVWSIALPMAAANALGAWCGASLAISKGSVFIRWIFLGVAVAIAVNVIVRAMA